MENSKNLELEILITVRQNRKVPISCFYQLFELQWKLYEPKFDQLITDGLVVPIRIADQAVYQLTAIGNARIAELLEKRETEITIRLLHLKQVIQAPPRGGKSAMSLIKWARRISPARTVAG